MLPWIFLLLSVGAWWIVLTTRSMTELVIALIAGLVLFVLGAWALISARVGHVVRTQGSREQALLLTTKAKPAPAAMPKRGPEGTTGFVAGPDTGAGPGRDLRADSREADVGGAGDGGGDGGGD
jgi:hypothetical protein